MKEKRKGKATTEKFAAKTVAAAIDGKRVRSARPGIRACLIAAKWPVTWPRDAKARILTPQHLFAHFSVFPNFSFFQRHANTGTSSADGFRFAPTLYNVSCVNLPSLKQNKP